MSKKFSKTKSWEQTALLKVPVKDEEEEVVEAVETDTAMNNASYAVSMKTTLGGMYSWEYTPMGGTPSAYAEEMNLTMALKKELEETKEELREANWKVKILEGILIELEYHTEEKE